MDTALWPQEFCSVKCMEELVPSAGSHSSGGSGGGGGGGGGGIEQQRRARPQKEQVALPCPRCNSTNTKFCYYNNYSLTQPRYFCKTCRRYWTEGGSLRNVPVGGGSRKNKRSTSNSATATSTPAATSKTISSTQKPKLFHEGLQDLSLAFPMLPEPPSADISAMELLRSTGRGLISPFMPMHSMPVPVPMPMPMPIPEYSTSGFVAVHQDYRSNSSLSFPLDGISGGYENMQQNNARLLFPFEDSRQVVTTSTTSSHDHQNNRGQEAGGGGGGDPPGSWSGMIGGGGAGGESW